jgi:Rab GDP dissociation inhibitor
LIGVDVYKEPFATLVKKFDLEDNTVDFIGHAVALFTSDDFLKRPCIETIDKIKLYMDSIGRYGDSPFIYPIYGLGGIPEGFSRMCAIFGGTFMLNKYIDKIIYENGKVAGVKSGEEVAKCSMVICSPYYVINTGEENKVKKVGKTIRAICIMDSVIPNTNNSTSSQIIIPQRQIGRKSGEYNLQYAFHQIK